MLFNDDVNVTITSFDCLSEVAKAEHFKSATVLTETEVKAISGWTTYSKTFSITAADKDKFVIFVKVTDNDGNIRFY